MPFVTILNGPNKDRQFPINGGEFVGRDPANALQVLAPGVSRIHFQFLSEGGTVFVVDRNSSNGTYVNTERVTRYALQNGDVVTVGGVNFQFNYENAAAAPQGVPGDSGQHSPFGGQISAPQPVAVAPNEIDGAPVATQGGSGAVVLEDSESEEGSLEDYALDASLVFSESTRFKSAGGGTSPSVMANLEKRLNLYHKISQSLATIQDLDGLLEEIIDNLFEIYPQADRGFIMMGDSFSTLEPRKIKHRSGDAGEVQISKTIARRVFENKRSILSSNAMEDSRFSGGMSILNFRILSMMCAPLIFQDEVFGIIHIDTMDRAKKFTPDDLNLLTGIAAQAATFVKNVNLVDQIQKDTEALTNLQRFFNPELASQIINQEIDLKPGGSLRTGTVFFSDIIGFTTMTEDLDDPAEVVELINQYFSIMVDIIFKYNGTIDKFGGDAIMAEWGVPFEVEDDALRGCEAAIEMQSQLSIFNYNLKSQNKNEIYMGIGLNTGEFIAGNIGSEKRMEFTCIGDDVNLAQRVESLAGRGQVYISKRCFEAAANGLFGICVGETGVKGRKKSVTVYSVRGNRTKDPALFVATLPIQADGKDGLIMRLKKLDTGPHNYAALCVFYEPPAEDVKTAQTHVNDFQELEPQEFPFTVRSIKPINNSPGLQVQAVVDFTDTRLGELFGGTEPIQADKTLEVLKRR